MASQALYRRYRSQTFSELVGQEHIVQTLRNALAEGRTAHAYLFTGPRGVGKTSVARLLAKAVNCTAAVAERPCGTCASCVAVAEGSAVDVIEMDAASHTSVEDAREIIERVQFRPTIGSYKVYIIDEVHMLSTAAFNALLKTLEEPPGHALFILATTEVHKVPKTILSRCQQFVFSRHTIAATAQHLHAIASEEGFALEAGVAEVIARGATGSMRDALSLLDQLMAYGDRTITLAQVRSLIGSSEAQEVAALVEALIGADIAGALRAVAGVAAQGADLRQFARDVVERLRALMLLKAGGDADLLDVGEDELAALDAQARNADLGSLLHWVKLFSGLDFQIRTSAIPQLPLEMAVVEALAAPAPQTRPVAAPAARPAATPQTRPAATRPAQAPVAAPARQPAPQQEPPALTPARQATPEPAPQAVPAPEPPAEAPPHKSPVPIEELLPPVDEPAPLAAAAPEQEPAPALAEAAAPYQENHHDASGEIAAANAAAAALEQVEQVWPAVVKDVRVVNKMVYAALNSGVRPIDIQETCVVLEVETEFLMSKLDQSTTRTLIERVLGKHMGANYTIRCVVREQLRNNPHALREQIRINRKDPLIRAAINIFDADIVAVERNEGE
ncbi:MAG TPA: DNA polymerase III subunit gamma/tau [Roseiflexaceae bacterium]|nr:DNA polymerase III subunit gamma/tau [Roseiflexaceae bacterium]